MIDLFEAEWVEWIWMRDLWRGFIYVRGGRWTRSVGVRKKLEFFPIFVLCAWIGFGGLWRLKKKRIFYFCWYLCWVWNLCGRMVFVCELFEFGFLWDFYEMLSLVSCFSYFEL